MHYLIYKTTNIVNGKYYIGKHKTDNLNDGYLGSGKLLKRAIKKYGIENFVKEILLECFSEEEMNLAERIMVVPDSTNYNLCEGGKGGWSYVNRIGLRGLGFKNNLGTKGSFKKGHNFGFKKGYDPNRINDPNTFSGKKHTIETKKKISTTNSKKQSGSKNSQYGTIWITNGYENKKIPKNSLDKWVTQGYNKGRVL